MINSDAPRNETDTKAMDRPSQSTPCVDSPWDDVVALKARLKARRGDRAAHRSHHSLYEDMLN
jgi:hypothetical protein